MQIRSTAFRLGLALALSLAAGAAVRAQEPQGGVIPGVESGSADDLAIFAVDLPQPPVRPRIVRRNVRPAVVAVAAPSRPVREQVFVRPVAVAKTFWLTVGTGF